jgi:hypothetical protein
MALPTPNTTPVRHRCFVSAIEVERPDVNRFAALITLRADNGSLLSRMPVVDGSKYRIGDVVWVTISEGEM